MRKLLFILLILSVFVVAKAEVLDTIVAKVGREIILQSELEQQISQLQAAGVISGANIDKLEVLNDMIDTKLLVMEADAQEYEIDDLQVKSMAEDELQRIINQFPSEEQFRKELKKQNLTPLELKEYYAEMIREQMLKEKIIKNEIRQNVTITEAELKDYYQENLKEMPQRASKDKIGMIMREITVSEETKKNALIEINKIRDQLLAGGSFIELAKQKSDGPNAKNGGDLGYIGRGTMVKPFEKAAFSLNEGEISDVVKTHLGYHIIQMVDKKDDEIRVRHILKMVEPNQQDVERAKKIIEKIKKQLDNGADFTKLAREYSMDDSSAANGGIIGEFTPEEYPEKFASYLKNLDYGEYSQIIKQDNVFYILAKLEKIPARKYRYEEIKDNLRVYVRNQKQLDLYEKYLDKLREKYYVEILLDES